MHATQASSPKLESQVPPSKSHFSLQKNAEKKQKSNVAFALLGHGKRRFYLPPDNPCCSQCQKALSYTKYGRAFRKKEPQNSAWRASSREMTSIGLSFFSYSLRILGSLLCRYHFFISSFLSFIIVLLSLLSGHELFYNILKSGIHLKFKDAQQLFS